jgi:hypothetical protein
MTGRRPFAFGVVVGESVAGVDTVAIGDTLVVQVGAGAKYAGTASLRISVPSEMKLLTGDTVMTVPLRQHRPPMALRLSAERPGQFEIRGVAVFSARGSSAIDEAEFVLPVRVDSARVVTGPVEYLRAERVLNGARFRYSRGWLIPVEEPTRVIDAEVERTGKGPAVAGMVGAECLQCPSVDDTVMFVAVVSAKGKLIGSRPIGLPGREKLPGQDAVKAARLALDRWQFRAAEFRGSPVAAWVYVRVPVRRAP